MLWVWEWFKRYRLYIRQPPELPFYHFLCYPPRLLPCSRLNDEVYIYAPFFQAILLFLPAPYPVVKVLLPAWYQFSTTLNICQSPF